MKDKEIMLDIVRFVLEMYFTEELVNPIMAKIEDGIRDNFRELKAMSDFISGKKVEMNE